MGALVNLFGDTPRVRLLEALVELAPFEFTAEEAAEEAEIELVRPETLEFTRPEVAEEAGLQKSSTYRKFDELASLGLVAETSSTRPATYVVDHQSPRIRVLGHLVAALEVIELHGEDKPPQQTLEDFRRRVRSVVPSGPVRASIEGSSRTTLEDEGAETSGNYTAVRA